MKHEEKFECDLCDIVFENETEKNLHIYSNPDSLTQRGKIMFGKIVILFANPFVQWMYML